tara:strand:+ start:1277 stop:1516 length:240 start_codon:yes stop_codon:yes gene_type:complete
MIDLQHYKTLISDRLKELGVRLHEIDTELGVPKPADWEEQAIDIEDDQVLEGLGLARKRKSLFFNRDWRGFLTSPTGFA